MNRLIIDTIYHYSVKGRSYGNNQVFSDENYNYSKNEDNTTIHNAYQKLQSKNKVNVYYNPLSPDNSYLLLIDVKKERGKYLYWGLALLLSSIIIHLIGRRSI